MTDLRTAWQRAESELDKINDGDWTPFTIHPDGHVTRFHGDLYAPAEDGTVYVYEDEDGQVSNDQDPTEVEGWTPSGVWSKWTVWSGYTGQYGYNGPIMHPSEQLRGGIVLDMVAKAQGEGRPVTYCCLIVDSIPYEDEDNEEPNESNPMGWALAELLPDTA